MYSNYIPYQNTFNAQYGAQNQKYEIIHVTGENGARMLNMMPNSSVLLLDDTQPIIWFVQTDGAGYKTVIPYKIEEYHRETESDYKSLENRIKRIEEMLNEPNNADARNESKPKYETDNGLAEKWK